MHGPATRASLPRHRLRQQYSSRNLTPPYRRSAARAKIIEDFPVRQYEQEPLANGHRGPALFAVEAGSGEIFKLLLVHTRRRSRSVRSRAELWRAAELRQPRQSALADNMRESASIFFVDIEAPLNDFFVCVVEAVFLQCALLEPVKERLAIRARQMEHLLHVDHFIHDFGLAKVSWNPVEHQRVDIRLELVRFHC